MPGTIFDVGDSVESKTSHSLFLSLHFEEQKNKHLSKKYTNKYKVAILPTLVRREAWYFESLSWNWRGGKRGGYLI